MGFRWDSFFETGIAVVDQQHRELVDRIGKALPELPEDLKSLTEDERGKLLADHEAAKDLILEDNESDFRLLERQLRLQGLAAECSRVAGIAALDAAISSVNTARAKLGAVQSRFENTISFLRGSVEQQAAAKGRITCFAVSFRERKAHVIQDRTGAAATRGHANEKQQGKKERTDRPAPRRRAGTHQ